jgi:hypothetical protein
MMPTIIGVIAGGVLVALALSLPFAWFTMLLWNWVMVDVFALPVLTYWQAWGLYMLSTILLKSSTK